MIKCKNLQVDIPEALKKAIKIEAAKKGITITALVQEVLEEYLEKGVGAKSGN